MLNAAVYPFCDKFHKISLIFSLLFDIHVKQFKNIETHTSWFAADLVTNSTAKLTSCVSPL